MSNREKSFAAWFGDKVVIDHPLNRAIEVHVRS